MLFVISEIYVILRRDKSFEEPGLPLTIPQKCGIILLVNKKIVYFIGKEEIIMLIPGLIGMAIQAFMTGGLMLLGVINPSPRQQIMAGLFFLVIAAITFVFRRKK